MHVHTQFPFLTRRMDTTSMVSIIEANRTTKKKLYAKTLRGRSRVPVLGPWHGQWTPFVMNLYFASAGSRMIARAFAQLFPFTICAHPECALPIAHDGDHLNFEGQVVS